MEKSLLREHSKFKLNLECIFTNDIFNEQFSTENNGGEEPHYDYRFDPTETFVLILSFYQIVSCVESVNNVCLPQKQCSTIT